MFRVYLNNTLVKEPIGIQELTTTIKRDRQVKGILISQDATLKFIGDGYDYLYSNFLSGSCAEVDCRIEKSIDAGANWYHYYVGTIKISKVTWDEKRQRAFVSVQDRSFFARINSNNNIGFYANAGRSKNDSLIDPVTIGTVEIFEQSTGTYLPEKVKCYNLVDLFRYAIEYCSDLELQFRSDYLTTSDLWNNLPITFGKAIRMSLDTGYVVTDAMFKQWQPTLSYKQIFDNINVKDPIRFKIDESTSPVTFRVENKAFFEDAATILTLSSVDDLVTRTDTNELYSRVIFGSDKSEDKVYLTWSQSLPFLGHKKEEYTLIGQCNNGTDLDLVGTFICDNNVIEKILVDNTSPDFDTETTYDTDWIFIESTTVGADDYQAIKSNILNTTGQYFYNSSLNNESVARRYFGSIPRSIASYIDVNANRFRAYASTNYGISVATAFYNPATFDNDSTNGGFDQNSLYDNTAGQYNYAPQNNVVYAFSAHLKIYVPTASLVRVRILRYDAGINLVGGINLYEQVTAVGQYEFDYSGSFYAEATDIITITIDSDVDVGANVMPGSYWECTNAGFGGIFATYDEADNPILLHELTYNFTDTQIQTLRNNPAGTIVFSRSGQQTRRGRVYDIKINDVTGRAKIILQSSMKLNN